MYSKNLLKHPIRDTTEAVCRSEQRGLQTGQCLTDSDLWGSRRGGETIGLDSSEPVKKD
jgi:hypothetical protein